MNYTEEQKKDITERVNKAIESLKELRLAPSALLQKVKISSENGADIYADQLQAYLQDVKYVKEGDKYIEANEPTPTI